MYLCQYQVDQIWQNFTTLESFKNLELGKILNLPTFKVSINRLVTLANASNSDKLVKCNYLSYVGWLKWDFKIMLLY